MLPPRYRKTKEAILQHLRRVAGIADEVGMQTLAGDVRQTRLPKLEQERFHVVVLGEFNHGKSTFVNALLGSSVLPTGITPTTAALNHVVHADAPRAAVVTKSGERIELTPSEINSYVTVAGGKANEVHHVEVGFPSKMLRDGVTLVDTPGVNDLNEQRAEITYGYVPRADAVLFLLDAGQALKESEREFLASHVIEGAKDRLIFILGKMDLLSPDERGAVTDYVQKGLAEFVDEPLVFPLSAKQWLDREDPDSGFPALLGHLERFLAGDRSRILLDNGAADAARTAAYLQQNLGVKVHALDLGLEELESRVGAVKKELDASKRTLDELHSRIRSDAAAIKAQIRLDLDGFARRFVEVIPGEIEKVDADDLKKYLGPFVEDSFKQWAEMEGEKVASLLEHLAEEVIAVTNENVASASQALASRLGPADTSVHIEVDSFKYDVGVYAVGALGTTVMFFINTLAGGLLTLAAPILAIVVKSKISGDIREQAKERVPAVILRAADVIGPHFDQCVDDFARRLGDFVTTAGNTLYRGISEILDQTIAERKAGAERVGERKGEIQALAIELAGVREDIERMRAQLWEIEEEPTETIEEDFDDLDAEAEAARRDPSIN